MVGDFSFSDSSGTRSILEGFHWRFRSFYLALFIPLPRNFWPLESRARAFLIVTSQARIQINRLKSWSQILKPGSTQSPMQSLKFTILYPFF